MTINKITCGTSTGSELADSVNGNSSKGFFMSGADSDIENFSGSVVITQTTTNSTTIAGGVLTSPQGNFTYIATGEVDFSNPEYIIPANGSLGRAVNVKFQTDADVFELKMINFNSKFMVLINDEPFQTAQFTTTAAGTREMLKFDMSGDTSIKTITVTGFNMPFGGVFVDAAFSVSDLSVTGERVMVAGIGDSYSLNTGANNPSDTWFYHMMKALGINDKYMDALSSSGWRTATPDTPLERINTYAQNLTFQPDVFVFALGYNDKTSNTTFLDEIEANAIEAINRVLELYPDVFIYVIGPWTPNGEVVSIENVKNRLIIAASTTNVQFVDISKVFTSVNWGFYDNGDNVHPNPEGHKYLGKSIASIIIS